MLSNAVDPASLTRGSARLIGPGDEEVPLLDGFPRAGPYGAPDGTHSVLLYPSTDLAPSADYRVVVSADVRDRAGATIGTPVEWSFRTAGCEA